MRLTKKSIYAGLAVTIIGLCAPTLAAAATEPTSNDSLNINVEHLTSSAALTSPTVFSGQLVDREERSAGTVVAVRAWPSAEELHALPEGEYVDIATVGYALTDENGNFDLKISDWDVAEKYRDANGEISLEVSAIEDTRSFTYSFESNATQTSLSRIAATGESIEDGESLERVAIEPLIMSDNELASLSAASTAGDLDPVYTQCQTKKVADNIGVFWVNLAAGYASDGATMKFQYKSGQSSSLGVGLSASGAAGSFSVSGTGSVASTATIDFPVQGNWKAWQSKFQYGKFHLTCVEGSTKQTVVSQFYAKPVAFAGGARIVQQNSYPTTNPNYCVSHMAGSKFTTQSDTAYQYAAGVQSAGTLGVNLTALTGYSKSASITFDFSKKKQLCGTHGTPANNPKRLVAK